MIHRLKFPTKASFTKAINALYPLDDEGNRIIPSGQVLVEIGVIYERTDDPEITPEPLDGYHADIVIPELPENLEKYVVEPSNPQHTVAGL
jgi:hypothetical protein